MNAPDGFLLPDAQNSVDVRELSIDRVGIKGIRYPIEIAGSDGNRQPTVAEFDMYVALPKHLKGTHMSRFIEVLEALDEPISLWSLRRLHGQMLHRLGADAGYIEMRFTYFVRKKAPVSGAISWLDYEVSYCNEVTEPAHQATQARIVVPITSLCPCSKVISNYGAHNQRSHVTITLELVEPVDILRFIRLVEDEASCEIYGLLKRPDEKYVTERAYDNPKFAEDLVRDVAMRIEVDSHVKSFVVEAENFESIHNHSACARINSKKDSDFAVLGSGG